MGKDKSIMGDISSEKWLKLFEDVSSISTKVKDIDKIGTTVDKIQTDVDNLKEFNRIRLPVVVQEQITECKKRELLSEINAEEVEEKKLEKEQKEVDLRKSKVELKNTKAKTLRETLAIISSGVAIVLLVAAALFNMIGGKP